MRISGFGFRQAEVQTWDCRHVSCYASYMVRVSVGRSDGCHGADSPFHAIYKISRILDVSAVLMMSINEGVNEAHHHDPILEASQEHQGDQVMEKMASPWKHRGVSTKRGKHIVQERTVVVMRERERVGLIWTSNSTRLFLTFSVKSSCRTSPLQRMRRKPTVSPGREARDARFI